MITNWADLRHYLRFDKMRAQELGASYTFKNRFLCEHRYRINSYIQLLRWDEYFSNTSTWYKLLFQAAIKRRRNLLGERLGLFIPNNTFAEGLVIWHYGSVIVNAYARIGKNCQLHGENCIGNRGDTKDAPVLGDNVNIGIGGKIIGNVEIANDVKIGANAVVIKSCEIKGASLGGVPAKVLGRKFL